MKSSEDIILKLEQLDSLMYCIEGEAIAVDEAGGDMRHLHNLIYLLWDQLREVTKKVNELNAQI